MQNPTRPATEGAVTYKQSFNAENRISGVSKMNGDCVTGTIAESWLFAYDGDGNRTTQVYTNLSTGSTLTTIYFMGGMYETTLETSTIRKYYSIAGMTVAMNEGGIMKYLLTDHLGSVVAVTNAAGSLTQQQRYLPFGQVRTDLNGPRITNTDFAFTGQRNVDGLGLMDYRARMYDAALGRFTRPDTITPGRPQGLNRFSYVMENPINATDPSGHDSWYCDGKSSGCDTKYLRDKNGVIGGHAGLPCTRCEQPSSQVRTEMENELSWRFHKPNPNAKWIISKSSNDPLSLGFPDLNIPRCGNDICREQLAHGPVVTEHWSASRVNWRNVSLDTAGVILSFADLNDITEALKLDPVIIHTGAYSTTTLGITNSALEHDPLGVGLSVAGIIPIVSVPASLGSLAKDLMGGYWETYDNKYQPVYGPPAP